MVIINKPSEFNLSGNLPNFRISSADKIAFILKQGSESILEQTYDPGPDGIIDIDIRDIVHSRLSFLLSDTSLPYKQVSLSSTFTAVIDTEEVVFKVVRAGVDRFADTATNFLQQNFLTWQPNVKPVTYYSPEFLTYYAVVPCTAKLKAYFTNDSGDVISDRTISLYSMNPGEAYTIPLQYGIVAGMLDSQLPACYDVWVENASSERLTYIQRYYASDLFSEQEQWVLFENSLGGVDTFRAYGTTDFTGDHTHNIAEIDDVSEEYRVDVERKFKKNTGHLNKMERIWLLDFFPSKRKYIYYGTSLRQIVVCESDVAYNDRELPSTYNFTYKYADARPFLNLARTDVPAEVLTIKVPSLGSFTVPPRLVEFSRLPLSEGALFPVQSPYSEEWGVTTAGSISDYIAERLAANYGGGGGIGHQHSNIDLLQLISYVQEYLLIGGRKIKSGYSDETYTFKDNKALEHIVFEDGITVYSPLSANELKKQSSDAVLETGENASDVISVNIVEEGNDPEILASGITEIATGVITVTTLGELDNVSEEVDSAPEGYILRKQGEIWVASPENITKGIVVDDTFGENNNTGGYQESASLVTSEFGAYSASIGITSSGRAIIARDYVKGQPNDSIRELAVVRQMNIGFRTSNTPIFDDNVHSLNMVDRIVDNISYLELDVYSKSVAFYFEAYEDVPFVDIYDEANVEISNQFSMFFPGDGEGYEYYAYYNGLVPLGTIKLKINTTN